MTGSRALGLPSGMDIRNTVNTATTTTSVSWRPHPQHPTTG